MSLFEVVRDELNLIVGPESERQPLDEDVVRCPECDGLATVEWRSSAAGTNGPVEHLKVRCSDGHWFLMPAAWLTAATA
jgi:hypothetical protein